MSKIIDALRNESIELMNKVLDQSIELAKKDIKIIALEEKSKMLENELYEKNTIINMIESEK